MDVSQNGALDGSNDSFSSREAQFRELYMERSNLENSIRRSNQAKQALLDRAKERTVALENTPSPVRMRVMAIIVFGIVLFRFLVIVMSTGEGSSWVASGYLISIPPYIVMVGLLAKACNRSAALTWFNLLTFGIYGSIFSLVMFIKSFSVKPAAIQAEIDGLKRSIAALECDIVEQSKRLIHIEAQINYLGGRF